MIFPWLRGVLAIPHAPVTWILFIANLAAFVTVSIEYKDIDKALDAFIADQSFLGTQSHIYAQHVERNPAQYTPGLQLMAKRAMQGHQGASHALSGLALRDLSFLSTGASGNYFGDEIAIAKWRDQFREFAIIQQRHPGQIWGVSSASTDWASTFTYQFIHGGAMHLLTNMFFLLIFGCLLEAAMGSLKFLGLYLFSGFAAALTFIQVTGLSMAPLIGASGAINGLVGFFAVLFFTKRERFAFFLLPSKGYWGFVELPVWIFVMIWTLGDLSSALGTVAELGGVAHTAHLGGFLFGSMIGFLYLSIGRRRVVFRSEPTADSVL